MSMSSATGGSALKYEWRREKEATYAIEKIEFGADFVAFGPVHFGNAALANFFEWV